jgi:hypothetical protein
MLTNLSKCGKVQTVQNLSSSHLLSKNMKIEIYKITISTIVLYGCETWSLTLREEQMEGAL